MSSAFLYARGARQGGVEGSDMWNQVLDNALRELAGRWETEGVGFMLARDNRKAQRSVAVRTMNHLTRILKDMTNATKRLGMRWKEKSLAIVFGPFTEYKPGDAVEIISNGDVRWIWRVVEGMESLGT